MQLTTVIFDMDGLLIDSEPLWQQAADEVLAIYGKKLSEKEYLTTTGLRTSEFIAWWLKDYNFENDEIEKATLNIIDVVTQKIKKHGKPMAGIGHIFNFFHERNFKIGIASSSPLPMIDMVAELLGIADYVQAKSSAEHLPYGKPHPQVFLDCATALGSLPLECICFEDSVNGMIAAKAARMKCIVVPAHHQSKDERWSIADLKLSSLQNFNELHMNFL